MNFALWHFMDDVCSTDGRHGLYKQKGYRSLLCGGLELN